MARTQSDTVLALHRGLANFVRSQIEHILGFVSVIANFMCQCVRTKGCPDSWYVSEGISGRD